MTAAAAWSPFADVVPLRRRHDLEVRASDDPSQRSWLVKDPITLGYYELPEPEYRVWQWLDGQATWSELRRRYEHAFAPEQIDGAKLLQLLEELHRRGLVVSERAGQGGVLRRRGTERRRRDLLARAANPLAIRLPGFDPQRLLSRLRPWVEPLFSQGFAVFCAVLCFTAIMIAVVHFADLRRELASAGAFPESADWSLWIGALFGAKLVHELAHACACRRYGGECREMGLLLLCGIPCLYCDVTSVWMTPERWKRILVGAAGVAAEVVLAAAAIVLWRFSEPGVFHAFCLHLAVVCSVGTVLVNANPLLRYDGYFVLSDALGLTNLGERADAALRDIVARWYFGKPWHAEREQPHRYRTGLALYSLASWTYRLVLTLAILLLVRRLLVPHGLALFSDLLALAVVTAFCAAPAAASRRAVRSMRHAEHGLRRRFWVRSGATVCFVAAVLLWPWPRSVSVTASVALQDAEYHYVVTGGRLIEAVELGEQVAKGDRLAVLEDSQLRLDLLRSEAEAARRRLEIENLERRRVADPRQGDALPTARELLLAAERQLAHLQREQARLQIVANRAGTVLPLFDVADAGEESRDRTSPLEPRRRGAYLQPGTPLCAVGDPARLEARLEIDQQQIEFIEPGQTVRLRFEAAPNLDLVGRIVETAERDVDAPATDSAAPNSASHVRYLARVVWEGPVAGLPVGAVGQAKIEIAPQSLWARARRTVGSTFRFVWQSPPAN